MAYNPLLKLLRGSYDKSKGTKYTTPNVYDNGDNFGELPEYQNAPEKNPYFYTPDPVDNNSYYHNQVRDTSEQLLENGVDIPKPDMVDRVEKRSVLQRILDPLNSIGYGVTNGLKSLADDNPDTGFFSGFGKGFKSAWTDKGAENREGTEGVIDTLLNSKNENKRAWGAGIAGVGSESLIGKLATLEMSSRNDLMKLSPKERFNFLMNMDKDTFDKYFEQWKDLTQNARSPFEQFEAVKNGDEEALKYAKENHKTADFVGDIITDPTSFIDGVGEAGKVLGKGTKAIKLGSEYGDINKALRIVENANKEKNALAVSDLMSKYVNSERLLGSLNDVTDVNKAKEILELEDTSGRLAEALKSANTLDEVKDVVRAMDDSHVYNPQIESMAREFATQNDKEAEYLLRTTGESLGLKTNYEGIKVLGKTVLDAEQLAKAGDTIWGKPLSAVVYALNPLNAAVDAVGVPLKAFGKTKLGQEFYSILPGTANSELVRNMKDTPEYAMGMQQLKNQRKQRIRDFFFKKETIEKNRDIIQQFSPDVQRQSGDVIENIAGETKYVNPRTVTRDILNGDYQEDAVNFLRVQKAEAQKAMAQLEQSDPSIAKALEVGMNTERLTKGQQEYLKLQKTIERIDAMSNDTITSFVDNLDKYSFDVPEHMIPDEFAINPMRAGSMSSDEVTKLFTDMGLDDKSARKAAMQIKQASDDTIAAVKKKYPELAPFYTGSTRATTDELLYEGASSLSRNSDDILAKIHEYDEALGRDKTKFAEGTTEAQMQTVLKNRKKALEDSNKVPETVTPANTEKSLEGVYERLNSKQLSGEFTPEWKKQFEGLYKDARIELTPQKLDEYSGMSEPELMAEKQIFLHKIKNLKELNKNVTVLNKLAKDGESKSIGIMDYIEQLSEKLGIKPRFDLSGDAIEANRAFLLIEKARMERKLYEKGYKGFARTPEFTAKNVPMVISDKQAEVLSDMLIKKFPDAKWLQEAGDDITRDIKHLTRNEYQSSYKVISQFNPPPNRNMNWNYNYDLKKGLSQENDLKKYNDESVYGKNREEYVSNESKVEQGKTVNLREREKPVENLESEIRAIQEKEDLKLEEKNAEVRKILEQAKPDDLRAMVAKQDALLGHKDTVNSELRNYTEMEKDELLDAYMQNRDEYFALSTKNKPAKEGQIKYVNDIMDKLKKHNKTAYDDMMKKYNSMKSLSIHDANSIIGEYNDKLKHVDLSEKSVNELKENLKKKIYVVEKIGRQSSSGAVLSLSKKMKEALEGANIKNLDEYNALNKRMQDAIENAKKHISEKDAKKIADSFNEITEHVQDSTVHELLQFNKDGKKINIGENVNPKKAKKMVDAVDNLPESMSKGVSHTIIDGKDMSMWGRNVQSEEGTDVVINGRLKLNTIESVVNHEGAHTEFLKRQWHVDRINAAIEKDVKNLSPEKQERVQELLDLVTKKSKGDLSKGTLTGYTAQVKATDGKKMYNHEQTSELSSLLLTSDRAIRDEVAELLPNAKESFYKYLQDAPIEEIDNMIPKHLPLRDELVAKAQRFKTHLDVFNAKNLKEYEELQKKSEILSTMMADKEQTIKYYETLTHESDRKNPKYREIEETVYDIIHKPATENLEKDVKNMIAFVRQEFKKMGLEEGIFTEENYKDFAAYVYHSWNPDLIKNKKYADGLKALGIDLSKPMTTDLQSVTSKVGNGTRKHQGTIKELNLWYAKEYMKKVLELNPNAVVNIADAPKLVDDLLSRVYAKRAAYNNELMFKKNALKDTLELTSTKLPTKEELRLMSKEEREAYFKSMREKIASGNYVTFALDPHYEQKIVKTISNEEIEEGFTRRNASMEAMREADTNVNQQIIDENVSPFIQINYRNIETDHELYEHIPGDKYIMSKTAYNNYKKTIDAVYKKQRGALLKTFDFFHNSWKNAATIWNPSYYVNNMIGNTFNSYLDIGHKVIDPKLNAEAFQILNALSIGKKDTIVRGKTVGEWERVMKQHGVINPESSYKQSVKNFMEMRNDTIEPSFLEKIKKYNPATHGRKIGDKIEGQSRIVNFLAHVDNGKSYREAADLTNKHLFDYSDISEFERDVVRRIVPFYTWMRKNIQLQMESLYKHPNKIKNVMKAKNAISEDETDKEKMLKPEYLDNAIYKGNGKYLNVNLPVNDLQKVLSGKDLFSSINPFAKLAMEETANKNMYFDSPIARTKGEKVEAPNYLKPFVKNSPNGKDMMDAKARYALKSLFPNIENVAGVANLFRDDATDAQKEKALGWLEGMREYNPDFDALQKQELQNYIDKLKDELYNKKKEGYVKPKTPQPQKQTNPLLKLLK